ncbi:MAG TPA: 3-deoxy-manno-octulosonate-8-phosphatase KdsC [Gammaproteobacteria bacterium]|nr:3-deoxy-manno-octulosonate-8-phosphatase KdsC [Gammaproteobacteria bacterium]
MHDVRERAAAVRLVIFDVDGVLTDGGLYFDTVGNEHKVFNSRDGHGLKMLQQGGVDIAVISGRSSEAVTHRMAGLGVRHVYQGQRDKLPPFRAVLEKCRLAPGQVAYVGDDVVDLPVMSRVGLAVAVADAHPLVIRHAHWRTPSPGGQGAARDVCELILAAQGRLAPMLAAYLTGGED